MLINGLAWLLISLTEQDTAAARHPPHQTSIILTPYVKPFQYTRVYLISFQHKSNVQCPSSLSTSMWRMSQTICVFDSVITTTPVCKSRWLRAVVSLLLWVYLPWLRTGAWAWPSAECWIYWMLDCWTPTWRRHKGRNNKIIVIIFKFMHLVKLKLLTRCLMGILFKKADF